MSTKVLIDVHICVAQSSIAHCSNPNTDVSVCESKPTCYTHIRDKRDQKVCREVLLWGLSAFFFIFKLV